MSAQAKAVSLMEIIIVMVIIAIAIGIFSTAGFGRNFEKQRSLEGLHNLQLIYNAEKRHLLDTGEYFNCSQCTSGEIPAAAGILLNQNYFAYSVSTFSSASGKGFEAVAVRKNGICQGKRMWLNQSSSDVVKECEAWK